MGNSYPTPPIVCPVMLQRWHEISFFHWSCDPALLQPRLPPGLRIDTHEGKAWISLTPFLLTGLRPPLFPHALGLTFPEMNLRTYAVGPDGPGIWFFSLDAARIIAVLGARVSYGLPYYWSDMRVDIDVSVPWSLKRGSGRRCGWTFRVRISWHTTPQASIPESVDHDLSRMRPVSKRSLNV